MNQVSFPVRGVIEGFYGMFYTAPERNDLISFISNYDYNLYIYGPKNDRQHRARWREPYPDFIMDHFKETIELSKKAGVEFCYAIGSGVSMNYNSNSDLQLVKSKFQAFYDIGVRTFMLMLDDISATFKHKEEEERFSSYSEAHVFVANEINEWLQSLDSSCRLLFCPTDYHGTAPFSDYILDLGKGLHDDIELFYTGRAICSKTITVKDANDFSQAVQREPIIWDNYPVNDLGMASEMHIGPITGRDPNLSKAVKGIAVNVMSQAEASKISLITFADYFENPHSYQPWNSWEKALKVITGEENFEAIKTFAENSLHSCLGHSDGERLEVLTNQALESLQTGEKASTSMAVRNLYNYLDSLDEAGYKLKFRMSNYALRNNIAPWIELMESWAWAGRRAITLLKALEKNENVKGDLKLLQESVEEVENHPKRYAGNILMSIIDYAFKEMEKLTQSKASL